MLGDPALDNEQEMQEASADLQSSREKSSTARDISDRLTAATRPETAQGERVWAEVTGNIQRLRQHPAPDGGRQAELPARDPHDVVAPFLPAASLSRPVYLLRAACKT